MTKLFSMRLATLSKSLKVWVVVVSWCLVFFVGLYHESTPHYQIRFQDFASIENALKAYHFKNGTYPISSGAFSINPHWIPELTPSYLSKVPVDPRLQSHQNNKQYLYISDGHHYKLIAHAPEDFGYVKNNYPERIDPRRPDYAYGSWTEGARLW